MKIIAVCGSVRFAKEMVAYRDEQNKKGNRVLLPENMDIDIQQIDERVKNAMDMLHLSKIRYADVVMFWNRNGYMGISTKRELRYATIIRKPIKFLERVRGTPADYEGIKNEQ